MPPSPDFHFASGTQATDVPTTFIKNSQYQGDTTGSQGDADNPLAYNMKTPTVPPKFPPKKQPRIFSIVATDPNSPGTQYTVTPTIGNYSAALVAVTVAVTAPAIYPTPNLNLVIILSYDGLFDDGNA